MNSKYIIVRSKKRKKSISIKVIDNEIIITAPKNVSVEEIEKCYQKHINCLKDKIDFDKNVEYIYYLGKKFYIKQFENGLLKIPICKIKGGYYIIYKPKNKDFDLKEIIKKWQKVEAERIIKERIRFFVENYNFNFSFKINKIGFKNQQTRWGSCSYCNNLNFNIKVIEKPVEVIDYLVVHELSHTIYKNHSKDFWEYVKRILPNYTELRKLLK